MKERKRKNGNPILHYFLAPLASSSSSSPSIEVNRSSRTSESLWQLTVLIRCTCVFCLSSFSPLFNSFFSSFPFHQNSLTFVSRLLSFELSLHSVICILLCTDDPFFLLRFSAVCVWKKRSVCACVSKEKEKKMKEIVLSEETGKDEKKTMTS